ncbi:unnamed protein product [Closterium sp. Naga37s-1]|nr:unnamed protein product [Closterium sp. Naga37s-1]
MVRFPFDLDCGWVLHQRTGRLEDAYTLEKELGRGHFGIVKLCRKRSGGGQYACKSIDKSKLSHWEDKEDVRREIEIMRRLSGNPYTLNLEDVFEDDSFVHLIMELCEGAEFSPVVSRKLPHASPQTPPRLELETHTSLLCASSRLSLSSSLASSSVEEGSVETDGARSEQIEGSESVAGEAAAAAADVQGVTLNVAPSLWGLFGGYQPDEFDAADLVDSEGSLAQTPQLLSCSVWGRSQTTDAVEIDWVFGF